MKILIFLCIVLINLKHIHSVCLSVSKVPIIETKYGKIEGTSDSQSYMYLGIPYALPPVNELRWKKPVDAQSWSPKTLQAINYQSSCPTNHSCSLKYQCAGLYSEDCLYLNVFVPKTFNKNNKKAVMVYIYGGNFDSGGASYTTFNATYIASYGDVIVVTFNYRVGALGFLMSGTETGQLEGNFGLMDQQLAIKWVYDNIDDFGGDNQRITLFGQSAGAQSVAVHLLNNEMQPYFNNAIIQSIPVATPFRTFQEAFALYSFFAKYINCTVKDIDCLRNKPVDDILKAEAKAESETTSKKFTISMEPWVPWIDGSIVKANQLEIENWLNVTNFKIKPFVIGTLTGEAVAFVFKLFKTPLNILYYNGAVMKVFGSKASQILARYPPNPQLVDQRYAFINFATDWIFRCSSRFFLNKCSSLTSNNLFYYVFDYPTDFDAWNKNADLCGTYVCHNSELPYLFNTPNELFTSRGRLLSLQMIRYWSNFAKYSNPNSNEPIYFNGELKNNVNWPSYDLINRQALEFKNDTNIIIDHYSENECDFFDTIGYYY